MRFFNKQFKITVSVIMLAVVAVSASFIISRAENVVILEETDPNLTLEKIHRITDNSKSLGIWDDITGSFSQNGSNYTLSSNGFAQWYDADSLHFAYKKVIFNYGKNSTLVAETTLNSWNAKSSEGGAGLMIRSSTDPAAATVMLHTRAECIYVTYRSSDNQMTLRGSKADFPPTYPVKFRIELNKNKVTCYYKQSTDNNYIKLGAVPFVYGPSVYIGLSAYSQGENDIAKSEFSGFNYYIEAPEGTEVSSEENSSGNAGGGSSNTPSEEVVILPEDPAIAEDVLLYETFSDGSITDGEESVTNPIWFTNNVAVDILTSEDKTNRYLSESFSDTYYHAGNEHWTDYETSIELTFTDEYSIDENNTVDVYTRLTSVAQYGYHAYVVRFTGGNEIKLGYLEGGTYARASASLTATVDTYAYQYLDKENIKTLKLRIRTFDNKITVYLDDGSGEKEILSYVDETVNVKSSGKIGFSAYGAAVNIDNIKVIKLDDLLGGDYDNKVSGMWDIETPEYIQEFIDNGFSY